MRVNKAYSINIDNSLKKKWECLHHCWVRWIGISMKKAVFDKKTVSAWGRSNGWGWVNAYWAVVASISLWKISSEICLYVYLGKMTIARNLVCRTQLFSTWTLTDTEESREKWAAEQDANLLPQALLFISRALVVDFVQPLIDFLLLSRAPAKEHVIYKGIFKQGQEHKHKTAHEVDVDGFHVGNLWESLPKVGINCGHGEHRCHTWVRQHRQKQRIHL